MCRQAPPTRWCNGLLNCGKTSGGPFAGAELLAWSFQRSIGVFYGLKQHSKVIVYRHSAQERGGSKRGGAGGLSWMFSPLSRFLSQSLSICLM